MSNPRLLELLSTMDVPSGRLQLTLVDVRWLLRNLAVRNANHPDFKEAIELLKDKQWIEELKEV